jgi:hypothetical protein
LSLIKDVIRLNIFALPGGPAEALPIDGHSDPIVLHRLGLTAQLRPMESSVTLVWPTRTMNTR